MSSWAIENRKMKLNAIAAVAFPGRDADMLARALSLPPPSKEGAIPRSR